MNNLQTPELASAQARTRTGGSWFGAIALFSIINAVIGMMGATIQFVVGLGLCEVFDYLGSKGGVAGRAVAFGADLIVAAVWWFFSVQAKKGARWAFIVGMIFYGIDGALLAIGQEWLSAAFHAYVLFRLYQGFAAAGELKSLQSRLSMGQGAWYGGAPQQPGAWPPAPGMPPQQPGQWPSNPGQPQPGGWPQQPSTPQQGQWPSNPGQPQAGGWPQQPSTPQFGAPPTQPGAYPPPPSPAYPPSTSDVPSTSSADWSQPAQPQALPSHWPAPAQPQPQPAPEAEG